MYDIRYNACMKAFIRTNLLAGLLVIVPFAMTAFVIGKIFELLDGWARLIGVKIPGVGLVVLFAVIICVGMLVRNSIVKWLYGLVETIITKVPAVSTVYTTCREVCRTVLNHDKSAFQAVVLLEYPIIGIKSIGFVTGDAPKSIETIMTDPGLVVIDTCKMVYVMQAFCAGAGHIVVVPLSRMTIIDMPVEDAMKLVLTGGMVKKE